MKKLKTKILNFFRNIFRIKILEKFLIYLISRKSIVGDIASKFAPNNYQYKKGTLRRFNRNGLNFIVDISEYLGHATYFGFKDIGQDRLFKMSMNKTTIIDIGANLGYTALNMAKNLDKNGMLYAFEPDTTNHKNLKNNLQLNPNSLIKIYKLGLGKTKGTAKLEIVTPDNFGGNRISKNPILEYSEIDLITLDDFCNENNLTKVDLIKIDVEGFEFNILLGGKNIIKNHRPELYIEVDNNNLLNQNSSAKELVKFIEEYYNTIINAQNGNKVSSNDDFSKCHFDLIAFNK